MSSSKSGEVHFLACVHGMWGIPEHVSPLEKTILKRFPKAENGTELVTLRVQTNADSLTYDGLDWGAERAVKEIYQKIEEVEKGGLKRVTKFSIVGYSLGGLISRYAIGILYQRGFFNNVKPMNFNTFATPHIGLPAFRGLIGRAVHRVGPVMLSRTGRQFYGTDNDIWSPGAKEGRPLLEVMSEKDTIFFKALSAFPHMAIYGNAVHDLTVTYCSSMIEPYDPFTKSHRLAIEMDTEYKHVIKKFYEVPEGEEVPMHDLAKELEAQRKSKPWYSPDKYGSGRPPVPPFLQFPFPLNILFYLSAPVLLPAMISFAALRLGRESIGSQKRLAQLAASAESESSLAAMLCKMEMAMADAVDSGDPGVLVRRRSNESEMEEDEATDQGLRKEEMVSQTEVEVRRGASSLPTPALTPSADSLVQPKLAPCTSPDPTDKDQPILTASHLKMIESLNSIPQLEKFRAYHPYVRNAHSVIVARDPGRMFPSDMDAYSVMRHWADRFVL